MKKQNASLRRENAVFEEQNSDLLQENEELNDTVDKLRQEVAELNETMHSLRRETLRRQVNESSDASGSAQQSHGARDGQRFIPEGLLDGGTTQHLNALVESLGDHSVCPSLRAALIYSPRV